ncbi:MAG TPA: type II toxin-antitoxin system VapC family toxin [Candidatus Saccharimonadia bacterium]
MPKICLDANILLELLFARGRSPQVIQLLETMTEAQFWVSVLSVDLVMYFVEAERASKSVAWDFLRHYDVVDLTRSDLEWARDNDGGDFEDALQIAVARRIGAQKFVTLDQSVAPMYGQFVPVVTVR